jgi:hypothetical protein
MTYRWNTDLWVERMRVSRTELSEKTAVRHSRAWVVDKRYKGFMVEKGSNFGILGSDVLVVEFIEDAVFSDVLVLWHVFFPIRFI